MKSSRRFRPRLEQLEDRIALNSSPTPLTLSTSPVPLDHQAHSASAHTHLSGEVSGTWSAQPPPPDGGTTQSLTGTGQVAPLGTVQATGTLVTPGFVGTGQTTGTMTLTTASGSITIQLAGPPQPGFSGPPTRFHFTITGGTGSFAGATGQGRAILHESPAQAGMPPVFTLTFVPRREHG
jgi:hypothetical protein